MTEKIIDHRTHIKELVTKLKAQEKRILELQHKKEFAVQTYNELLKRYLAATAVIDGIIKRVKDFQSETAVYRDSSGIAPPKEKK